MASRLSQLFRDTKPEPRASPDFAKFSGVIEKGNIDLENRPIVKNKDGSISTVNSMSFQEEVDGPEILIPTTANDGSRLLSGDEAIAQYKKSGKFLGKFKTPDEATKYAEALHTTQEEFYNKFPGKGPVRDAPTSNTFNLKDMFKQALGPTLSARVGDNDYEEDMAARGIRNNNPGNIDRNKTKWQGMSADQSKDNRFVVFDTPESGIRAIGKVLTNYQRRHGIKSIDGIINRWAPPVENDTGSYVRQVASAVGVNPEDEIDVTDPKVAIPLVKAIIKHENGEQPYTDQQLMAGLKEILKQQEA